MQSSGIRLKTLSLWGRSVGEGQTTGGLKKRIRGMAQLIKGLQARMKTRTGSNPQSPQNWGIAALRQEAESMDPLGQ